MMVKVTKNIGLQGGILPTYTGKSQASKIKAIPKVMLKTENKILGAMGHVAMSLYNGTIGNALKVEKRHQKVTNSKK